MDTIMKAVDLMEKKQTEKALKMLSDYLPFANDEKKYTIADVYIQWGFLQEAKIILEELLQLHPYESEIKVMLATVYIELKEDKVAINLLDDIKQEDPLYVEVLLQLADLYQSEGLYEVAEMKLLEAKKANPTEPIIDFALGEFFFSIGEYKRSIIYYEKLLPEITELANISIKARLAESYAASGEYEIALRIFQETESEDPDILFKYGFTAYYANRKDIAINIWNKVIALDDSYHSVYYELAKAYFEENLVEKAYETGKKGLKMDEFNKELYYYTGMLAHQLNKLTESEELIRRAIDLDYDYKEAILFLIELLKGQDDYDEIIRLIEDVKQNGAEDPLYDWELARAYNETDSYENALKYYSEAYNSLSQDSIFLKEYGYFLSQDGKLKEAITIFESYLIHEPSDVETMEYIERLKVSEDI